MTAREGMFPGEGMRFRAGGICECCRGLVPSQAPISAMCCRKQEMRSEILTMRTFSLSPGCRS
jgi:hypothetical protein